MGLGILTGIRRALSGVGVPLSEVDMSNVSTEQLERSHQAGLDLEALQLSLASEERTPVGVVMNGNPFAHWQMYPWQGGITDQRSSSQYFYHSHEDYKGEHGHFHTFVYHKRKLVHLVAIGMDRRGRINKLYTFNRWSPADHYFPAHTLKTILPRFNIRNVKELDKRLHQFINHTLVLFHPEIEVLFDERDETFADYRKTHGDQSPYDDRSLEITSSRVVDVKVQLARIRAELAARGTDVATAPDSGEPTPAPEQPSYVGEIQAPPMEERKLEQLKRAYQAGKAVRECMATLEAGGSNLAKLVLNGKAMEDWEMYPWESGIHDKKTRSQYFYHHHPQTPEHGHFHVFFHHGKQLAHLVTLSMDDQGEPLDLFTVNRWVTGDINLPAEKLKAYLPRFKIDSQGKFRQIHDFLRDMFMLYQEEICMLLDQREQVYKNYRLAHNGDQPYEDRDLDITSSLPVNLDAQIESLEAELRRRDAL